MTVDVSLGEFVKQLTLRMDDANLTMLLKEEKPWHLLFYGLKRAEAPAKPKFFTDLRFDWDGPYPRCQELSEFIQALHWTGSVIAANPSYERIMLQEDVKSVWAAQTQSLSPELNSFLDQGLELAKTKFPLKQQ